MTAVHFHPTDNIQLLSTSVDGKVCSSCWISHTVEQTHPANLDVASLAVSELINRRTLLLETGIHLLFVLTCVLLPRLGPILYLDPEP